MKYLKRLLVAFTLSVFVLSVNAQTVAGKFLLGGSSSMDFSSSTQKYKTDDDDGTDGKLIQFSLTPLAGYFVVDGLAVGLQLEYDIYSYKDEDDDERFTQSVFMFSPFVRYYYGTAPIKPFAEIALGVGSQKIKEPDYFGEGTQTSTSGIFGFQFKLGAAYFLNDNVSIDAGIGFARATSKPKEDNDVNYRDIASGIGFEFGITIVL